MTKSWLTGDIKDAAAKKGGLHQFLGIYILKARLFQVFYQCAL